MTTEIVGAVISGNIFTNDPVKIRGAAISGTITRFLPRDEMLFMSSFDLGMNWDNMARGKTLFILDNQGKPQFVEGGAYVRKTSATSGACEGMESGG